MSYKALYRVYRPSTFNDIQGQEHIRVTLMNIVKNDKLSHAYLFSGPRGTGKTSIARIFAKTINCPTKDDGINACEKCSSCLSANQNKTLDIIEMDAASNNGVAEIREVRENIKFSPSESQYKVYIIDEIHMLSKGAFNALLKILEDPPKHAVFILATTEPSKIPMTILSRVQRFNFKQIENDVIAIHLKNIFIKENIKYEPEAIDIIVSLSNGSLRDALSISDQSSAYTNSNIKCEDLYRLFGIVSLSKKIRLINLIFEKNLKSSLKLLNNLISDGIDIKKLVENLIDIIKDYIVYNTTHKKSLLVVLSIDDLDLLKLDSKHAYLYIETLIDLLNQLYKTDVPEQSITIAILKMIKLDEKKKSTSITNLPPLQDTDEFSTKELSLVDKYPEKEEKDLISDQLVENSGQIDLKEENIESILDDFKVKTKESDFNVSVDQVEKIDEMIPVKNDGVIQKFDDDDILNLLVQFKTKSIEKIKEKSKELINYLSEDSMKEYIEWLTSPSLKLLSAGDEFILFATTDNDLWINMNRQRRKKHFVATIKEVFDKDYSIYVIVLEQWYKIKNKYMELKKSGSLPKAKNIIKNIEETDEERYGTELFGQLFNSK